MVERLDWSLDELLTVRVALTPTPLALSDFALDEALRRHPSCQEVRKAFSTAIETLLDAQWDCLPEAVFEVEAAANGMVGHAIEATWGLALLIRPS